MARFAIRWVTYAEQQRDVLSPTARGELDRLLDQLTADPYRCGTYSKREDQWSATFGSTGVILYTIEDQWITVTVLRVLWVG